MGGANGAHVNVTKVPIDTLHQQIFSDLSTGSAQMDAYQTAAWFYGDFFTAKEPYIVELGAIYPPWPRTGLTPACKVGSAPL